MPDDQQTPPTPRIDYRSQVLFACRNLFQQRLRKIVGAAGGNISASLDAFNQEIGKAYDTLSAAKPLDAFDQADHLTASRLTLIGEDDLEVGIRLREIANHLREKGGAELWRSGSLFKTLLQRSTMEPEENPVGPDVIAQGLSAICAEYAGSLEQTFTLLDRVEDLLAQGLPTLYREINQLLSKLGVEPAQAHYVTTPTTLRANDAAGAADQPAASQTLSLLQDLLRHRSGQAAPAADDGARPSALDAAGLARIRDLLDRLTALESQATTAPTRLGHDESSPTLPPRTLRASDLGLSAGRSETITLETMALIFDAIFESPELADAVKGIIGRLQIPLLKLALVDPSLFADHEHPGRRLIDRLARAAIGLPLSISGEHPVCKRIAAIVARLREANGDGSRLLAAAIGELDTLIGERDQAVERAAAGHVRLVTAHEQTIHAEQAADRWLRASLARNPSPEIASFLERYWLRVMVAAARAGGTDGERWQQDSATGGELIWSVQPKQTSEERKHLAGLVSTLVRRIGAALDGIGVSTAERLPFLNRLFDLQTAALRGQVPESTLPTGYHGERRQGRPPAGSPAVAVASCTLRDGDRQVYYVAPADDQQAATASSASAGSDWQVGDWLRFCVPEREHEPLCGLCCWQSQSAQTVLLFNPDWGYAVAMPRTVIDQQMHIGRAQIVSAIATFDKAAENALRLLD